MTAVVPLEKSSAGLPSHLDDDLRRLDKEADDNINSKISSQAAIVAPASTPNQDEAPSNPNSEETTASNREPIKMSVSTSSNSSCDLKDKSSSSSTTGDNKSSSAPNQPTSNPAKQDRGRAGLVTSKFKEKRPEPLKLNRNPNQEIPLDLSVKSAGIIPTGTLGSIFNLASAGGQLPTLETPRIVWQDNEALLMKTRLYSSSTSTSQRVRLSSMAGDSPPITPNTPFLDLIYSPSARSLDNQPLSASASLRYSNPHLLSFGRQQGSFHANSSWHHLHHRGDSASSLPNALLSAHLPFKQQRWFEDNILGAAALGLAGQPAVSSPTTPNLFATCFGAAAAAADVVASCQANHSNHLANIAAAAAAASDSSFLTSRGPRRSSSSDNVNLTALSRRIYKQQHQLDSSKLSHTHRSHRREPQDNLTSSKKSPTNKKYHSVQCESPTKTGPKLSPTALSSGGDSTSDSSHSATMQGAHSAASNGAGAGGGVKARTPTSVANATANLFNIRLDSPSAHLATAPPDTQPATTTTTTTTKQQTQATGDQTSSSSPHQTATLSSAAAISAAACLASSRYVTSSGQSAAAAAAIAAAAAAATTGPPPSSSATLNTPTMISPSQLKSGSICYLPSPTLSPLPSMFDLPSPLIMFPPIAAAAPDRQAQAPSAPVTAGLECRSDLTSPQLQQQSSLECVSSVSDSHNSKAYSEQDLQMLHSHQQDLHRLQVSHNESAFSDSDLSHLVTSARLKVGEHMVGDDCGQTSDDMEVELVAESPNYDNAAMRDPPARPATVIPKILVSDAQKSKQSETWHDDMISNDAHWAPADQQGAQSAAVKPQTRFQRDTLSKRALSPQSFRARVHHYHRQRLESNSAPPDVYPAAERPKSKLKSAAEPGLGAASFNEHLADLRSSQTAFNQADHHQHQQQHYSQAATFHHHHHHQQHQQQQYSSRQCQPTNVAITTSTRSVSGNNNNFFNTYADSARSYQQQQQPNYQTGTFSVDQNVATLGTSTQCRPSSAESQQTSAAAAAAIVDHQPFASFASSVIPNNSCHKYQQEKLQPSHTLAVFNQSLSQSAQHLHSTAAMDQHGTGATGPPPHLSQFNGPSQYANLSCGDLRHDFQPTASGFTNQPVVAGELVMACQQHNNGNGNGGAPTGLIGSRPLSAEPFRTNSMFVSSKSIDSSPVSSLFAESAKFCASNSGSSPFGASGNNSANNGLASGKSLRHPAAASNSNQAAKKYHCDQCSKAFTRSDMLTRHKRLHSGDRPFQCNECKQEFSRSDHLSTHMRTHTGEKPYKCKLCSYSACRKDMITRHMKVHNRISPGSQPTTAHTIGTHGAVQ